MAVFATGKAAGTLTRVDLLDASYTGLGFMSPVSVEPGTSVSVDAWEPYLEAVA